MGRLSNSGALTESVYYILLRLHSKAHGYALMKDIMEMTNGRVNYMEHLTHCKKKAG